MAYQTHLGPSRPDPTGHVGMDYGADHHHKPTKAIIGVAIMVVLGFLTYEFKGKTSNPHSSAVQVDQPVHQTIASIH